MERNGTTSLSGGNATRKSDTVGVSQSSVHVVSRGIRIHDRPEAADKSRTMSYRDSHGVGVIVPPIAPSVILVPAVLESLAVVRAAITRALQQRGWEHDPASRVVLAASEATANAVEHGSAPGEFVEVVYRVDGEHATVRVLDCGHGDGWQPPAAPQLPHDASDRGRGLVMMQQLADHMEVVTDGPGTELRLDFDRAA